MADLTRYLSEFAGAIETLLEANKVTLGLQDVWYGDQALVPRTPAVAVEPGTKDVQLNNAFRRPEAEMTVYILVYHATFGSPQDNRRDADLLAEEIEDLLNNQNQMSGLVIHSYVSRVESGYATKNNTMMRSTRLTFTGLTKYQLSS